MPTKESDPGTLEDGISAARLKDWKERRAKVAEKSRNERLRQAEADRQARIAKTEEDRLARAREAAEKRARDVAQEKADRRAAARAKLVGRAEIDAARERLTHFRARAARLFAVRVVALILLPTALVSYYLFAVATPLYRAEAVLAVAPPSANAADRPIFSPAPGAEAAHQIRAILQAPSTLAAVEAEIGLIERLSGPDLDPIRRLRDLSAFQITPERQLARFVAVDVRAFEGLVTLRTLAVSPGEAEAFANALLATARLRLTATPLGPDSLVTVVPPKASAIATNPSRLQGTLLALIFFVSLYAIGSIFSATLSRHALT